MTQDPKQLVRQSYDAVSRAYRGDQVDHAREKRYAQWVSLLEPFSPPGGDVLDLGCGCGLPGMRLLAGRYRVTGVDISPVQIERARSLVPLATFHCADITSFPFAPASNHAIVSFYAIIHVPIGEQRDLIRRATDALRPGGAMLLTVGHQPWTGTEHNWLGVPGITMYWSPGGDEDYRRWILEAGLEIRRCEFVPEGGGGHCLVLAVKTASLRGS